jgi:hypothetical protein
MRAGDAWRTSRISWRYDRRDEAFFHNPSPSFISLVSSVNLTLAATGSALGLRATSAVKYCAMIP